MRRSAFVGILSLLLAGGCTTQEQAYVTDVTAFDPDHTAIVRMENHRANSYGELKIFLRTDDRFTEDSLTVRVVTFTPDSLRTEELHRLILPRPKRINALKQILEIPYRRSVRLRHEGTYYFSLTPTRSVAGIEAVGIRFSTE